MSMHPDWIIPDWPAPQQVHAVCSTRAGGVSLPPYDSLNLGDHVGDLPADVAANRAIFSRSMSAKPVFLSQVHGTHTHIMSSSTRHGTEADGCFTDQTGVACTIMVADCLPVLFTNVQGTQIAAAHAGWRSLAGKGGKGVLETVFKCFTPLAHVERAQAAIDVIAWLGPCIGPDAFEVGDEVREIFVAHDATAAQLFKALPSGKWLADLQGLARLAPACNGSDADLRERWPPRLVHCQQPVTVFLAPARPGQWATCRQHLARVKVAPEALQPLFP